MTATPRILLFLGLSTCAGVLPSPPQTPPPAPWEVSGLSVTAAAAAHAAWTCALARGEARPDVLAVIDYSLPSTEKRLWVLDPRTGEVRFREWVAHGKNTGGNEATSFSNVPDSKASSLGVFRAAETYTGKHGYSLKLDGLDRGFNDNARSRAIVIHGADYVSESFIDAHGRLGRSWGCPAVRPEVAGQVIDALERGGLVVAWYPDADWQADSAYLACAAVRASESAVSMP